MEATVQVSEKLKLHNKKLDEYQSSVVGSIDGFKGVITENVSSMELMMKGWVKSIEEQNKQFVKVVIENFSALEEKLGQVQRLSLSQKDFFDNML